MTRLPGRRRRDGGAVGSQRVSFGLIPIPRAQGKAGGEKATRHAATHQADAEKGDRVGELTRFSALSSIRNVPSQ